MRGIIREGIHVIKNCKAVSSKDSRNNGKKFRTSCNHKINRMECKNGRCYAVINKDITVVGTLQRRWVQVSRENIIE